MVDPVLRPGKCNTKVFLLCHFTRHLESLVFLKINQRACLKFIFTIDSNPEDLWGAQECAL